RSGSGAARAQASALGRLGGAGPQDAVLRVRVAGSWEAVVSPERAGESLLKMGTVGGERTSLARHAEPPPEERLPPRELGTKRRRTTGRPPEEDGEGNAPEVEGNGPLLERLPTRTDQPLPTPG